MSVLEEHRAEFTGLYVEMRPRRRYLLGEAAAHVLGYVGEITAEELDLDTFADDRYRQGMLVGKNGIESQYEQHLQGRQGLKYLEFDARGGIVGDFGSRWVRRRPTASRRSRRRGFPGAKRRRPAPPPAADPPRCLDPGCGCRARRGVRDARC